MRRIRWNIVFIVPLVALAVALWAPLHVFSSPDELAVDPSAKLLGRSTQVCVTNAAGGTLVPTAGLTNRKAVELQNLSANAMYCTVDGQAPLATGALGRQIAANGGVWSVDAGRGIVLTCIAATAAQVTPACTQVTELR